MENRFFLNSIRVWEPVTWDQVKFTLKRSDTYNGMEFAFSDELTFDRNGADYLRAAYASGGIDAEVVFRWVVEDCGEKIHEYTAIVNFNIYKENTDGITVGIRQSGFSETFKNRMDTQVNLSAGRNLDGGSLSDILVYPVRLHSKEILLLASWKINTALAKYHTWEFSSDPNHVPPLELLSEELEGALQPSYFAPVDDHPLFYSGLTLLPGQTDRTIQVRGRFVFSSNLGAQYPQGFSRMKAQLFVKDRTSRTLLLTKDLFTYQVYAYPRITSVDESFDTVVSLPADSQLYIQIDNIDPIANHFFEWQESTFLNLSENSIYPPSTADGYLAHEVLSRITEAITGVPDSFRSDYFGRTDSMPADYASDGEGSMLFITNGLNLRNMLDKQGNKYPVTASFSQIFDSLDAIHNLGMRIEREGTKEYVRVEPKAYFYNTTPKLQLSFVGDLETAVALDVMHNEAEFGYQKWETENVNGIDEFNTKRSYSLPLKNQKKKFSRISNFITGGYPIEFTRRQQFKSSPTTDYRTDNDLFAICVVREFDPHDPEKFGYVAERVAGFEPVENLFSPFTAYNLRISPARNALRHRNVLAPSLYRKADKTMRFTAGQGNYLMESGGVKENQDIPLTVTPLYEPETDSFSNPLTFEEFLHLRDNAIYTIEYSCNDYGYRRGFLREVSWNPQQGIAQFRTLKAPQ